MWQSSGAKCALRLDSHATLGMTEGWDTHARFGYAWRLDSRACARNDKGKMESSVFVIARSNESCDVAI